MKNKDKYKAYQKAYQKTDKYKATKRAYYLNVTKPKLEELKKERRFRMTDKTKERGE